MSAVTIESVTTTVDRPARSPARLSPKRLAVLGLAAVMTIGATGYGVHWWRVGRFIETTDDAYVGGNVTPIAPHVSGFIAQILVTDNQYVRKGQPLLRIDARDFQAALDRAAATVNERQADLASLEARYSLQQTSIRQAKADLEAKKATTVFASADNVRYRALASLASGSRQDAERALAANQTAQAAAVAAAAALDAARQQLAVLDAEIVGAKAAEVQAEADLRTARFNLGYTEIDSPVDGYVGNRYAQAGAYVTAGTTMLSIVPANGLWVDANFKEDELARMKPGQPVTVVADVLPGLVFHGHVLNLAPATGAVFSVIPAQNATGNFTKIVQRVPVRIALDGDGSRLGQLRAGLSTTVAVDTRQDPGSTP